MRATKRARIGTWLLYGAGLMGGVILILLIVFPVAALFLRIPTDVLVAKLDDPMVRDALKLSVVTTFVATVATVLLGLPLAWLLARGRFPGKGVLEVIVLMPMVLPPTVAGLGLLLAFGRAGLAGGALGAFGISLPFTTAAVIVAQVFTGAPFFVAACVAGFRSVDERFLDAAAAHRASPGYAFFHVTLPIAVPSVVAGIAMSWARALGEFGATMTFAGALQGKTQTMPIAVYVALESDLNAAIALSIVLVVVSFVLLFGVRYAWTTWQRGSSATHAARAAA